MGRGKGGKGKKGGGGGGAFSETPALYVDFRFDTPSAHPPTIKGYFYLAGRKRYPEFRAYPYVLRPDDKCLTPEHHEPIVGNFDTPEEFYDRKWQTRVLWTLYDYSKGDLNYVPILSSYESRLTVRVEDASWEEWEKRNPDSPRKYSVDYFSTTSGQNKIPRGREEKLSRKLSEVLRHRAEHLGLQIDAAGFVLISDLLNCNDFKHFAQSLVGQHAVGKQEIVWLVKANQKQRFELDNASDPAKIRCTQGHSVKAVDVAMTGELIKDAVHYFQLIKKKGSSDKNDNRDKDGDVAMLLNPAAPGVSRSTQKDEISTGASSTSTFGGNNSIRAQVEARKRAVMENKSGNDLKVNTVGASSAVEVGMALEDNATSGRIGTGAGSSSSATSSLFSPASRNNTAKVVHGTFPKSLQKILESGGLSKMERNEIHFCASAPEDGSVMSGMRQEASVVIEVDLEKCLKHKIKFYYASNGVILSPGEESSGKIGPEYFLNVYDRWTKKTHPFWTQFREREAQAVRNK
ncbi:unnamed protein product [Amoebophrya sp. A120]|nr:unnamed protein product [Amoebophrya sp. A120]|eukprot:GSA120T00009449001.1